MKTNEQIFGIYSIIFEASLYSIHLFSQIANLFTLYFSSYSLSLRYYILLGYRFLFTLIFFRRQRTNDNAEAALGDFGAVVAGDFLVGELANRYVDLARRPLAPDLQARRVARRDSGDDRRQLADRALPASLRHATGSGT